MSVIFPPAILGPEMAVPILWAPGIFWFFLLENTMPIKVLAVGGRFGFLGRGGGWKCQFYFYGRGDFSDDSRHLASVVLEKPSCERRSVRPKLSITELSTAKFWSFFQQAEGVCTETIRTKRFRMKGSESRWRNAGLRN